MPLAVLWNHRYTSTIHCPEWDRPVIWLVSALRSFGWNVAAHPEFKCSIDLPTCHDITAADLVIYTHSHLGEVRGFNGRQWFLKSTGPSQFHTTLDELGFGPYSSPSYEVPNLDEISPHDVRAYFATKVPEWIRSRTSKWGDGLFGEPKLTDQQFPLVLAQSLGDETVTSMYFGNYWSSLMGIVAALAKLESKVVVKLHPWTDGHGGFREDGKPHPPISRRISKELKQQLLEIGPNIEVWYGMTSVHAFLERCKYVVTCNSTAGIEALLHKRPVISWGLPEYHCVTYDLRHLCDMPRAIKLDWFDEERVGKFVYWYTEQYAAYDLRSMERRVSQLLGV